MSKTIKQIIKYGKPYMDNTDGRKRVVVYFNDGTKRNLLYSRLLMCLKEGRVLETNEHVDHKDEDKTNDDIDNLQILLHGEHTKKSIKCNINRQRKVSLYKCPKCEEEFLREDHIVKSNKKCGYAGPFCSRSCARSFNIVCRN